ncbi:hypothetical protein EJ06DRAFT_195090 [Trichodelitschia bisporula]|uniref:Uncharacterized protein n=1 Tax=Trichodelitschia bisporula TaxID=703511 RepID=A0A6G1I7W2_9PEZI|nr:hypothetical protein EJ06DRAFT_195090 [Trichodelitschia bisporula]
MKSQPRGHANAFLHGHGGHSEGLQRGILLEIPCKVGRSRHEAAHTVLAITSTYPERGQGSRCGDARYVVRRVTKRPTPAFLCRRCDFQAHLVVMPIPSARCIMSVAGRPTARQELRKPPMKIGCHHTSPKLLFPFPTASGGVQPGSEQNARWRAGWPLIPVETLPI